MNEYIAAAVDELYELGVREAVMSPGSRSTPLSMFFCEHNGFKTYLDIDERSAGFFALGMAKEWHRPVVLVCTSGSAAAHYLPSVIEAKLSRVALIILTADRPAELRNVGAPQTIDQNGMFGKYVNNYEELSIPKEDQYFIYPRIVMQKAFLKSMGEVNGPVHINVPLCEPLVPELEPELFKNGRTSQAFQFTRGSMHTDFDFSHFETKKGIVVCGADAQCTYQQEIISLGERLKIPVIADPLSNIRCYESDVIIDSYDAFLKDKDVQKELCPEYILLFGQAPVSKRLYQFITQCKGVDCIQVDSSTEYRNPCLTTTQYIKSDVKGFVQKIQQINKDNSYLCRWQYWQKKMRTKLETARLEDDLFEGKIVQLIQDMLPEDSRLAVANSMSIRDVDFFWKSCNKRIKILCNRGTNGIDGTISTALGISTSGHPTVLLTGDLALFHDMNGFLLGKMHCLHLVVVLLNNNGGGIFQYLPQRGGKFFDYLFSTPHGINFEGIRILYGVEYCKIDGYDSFCEKFKAALQSEGMHILEININQEKSWKLHERYTMP